MQESTQHAWRFIVLGTVALAALNTLGDWIWAVYIPRGQMIHGVVHGAVLWMALGIVLGQAAGTTRAVWRGVSGQLVIGLLVSASFYPLFRLIGWTAMVIDWMLLWILTGWLNRWLRESREPLSRSVIRGVMAAVFSGLAFYAVSDIWTTAHEGGYLWNFACWLFAFFPGLFAMLHPWPKR